MSDITVLITLGDIQTRATSPRCGDYVAELIQKQTRRIGKLHPDVLADQDPEALHQLRVTLRRLRTVLTQFGPALKLPDGVSEQRLARVTRQTGLTRDLDVLRQRLEIDLFPALPISADGEESGGNGSDPEARTKALKRLLKELARNRRQAFEGLEKALQDGHYLKMLARLSKWLKKPDFTILGQQPIGDWLVEWQGSLSSGLFLHAGWQEAHPRAKSLHELRKRIKEARYSLENLEPFLPSCGHHWIEQLKHAQESLGELHDLQVLADAIAEQDLRPRLAELPELERAIQHQLGRTWEDWQRLASRLKAREQRWDYQGLFLPACTGASSET
ncbi:CHAD domain-containing protein [Synechococcus sp. CS-1328]|uniref:CHAD domain-containing protein n=1 Tax=Synechococcus sp. CS-1328 TaxID=2847976 RepID=UPI00223B47E0|nr:CHAD domain-containing protein [Synechococcus sp. CS-1328]MCT0226109.1 CHAD domain-containing protein [Synechococcus sp. CS-1328]